jgi:membrane-bound lytic murein transglycosylase B
VLDQALVGLRPVDSALERDRAQPEAVLSLDAYLKRRLKPATVRTGRRMLTRHRRLLRRVYDAYGVPPRVLVAVWGLESEFGRFRGVRPTVPTLATLAYDSRRPDFFRGELLDALLILDRGDVPAAALRGSWAGAVGQPQFLPSSYLAHAQDFDGDGRRDIWESEADVFASIAHYLRHRGWREGEAWGQEAAGAATTLEPAEAAAGGDGAGCAALREIGPARPLAEWRRLGVTRRDGGRLPRSGRTASLLRLGGRSFLVTRNYEALLGYNCAHAYALSVALLADRLR